MQGNVSFATDVATGAIIVTFPVVAMIIGSVIAVWREPSGLVRGLACSIASGILTAAVALELLPKIVDHDSEWWPGPLGFALGLVLFSLLKSYLPDGEDDEDDEDGQEGSDLEAAKDEKSPLVSGAAGALARKANSATPVVDASLQSRGRATPVFSGGDHDGGMRNPTYAGPTGFAGPGGSAADSQLLGGGGGRKALPWTRIAVVALDGAIDGLTLGIASSIGLKEAALIAVAMTLEMCFVGVALSCKIRESNRSALITYAIVMVVPLFMYVGFTIGAYALYGIEESDPIFIGVIGFSAAALLFLALGELMEEIWEEVLVKETPGLTPFWVTTAIFSGFFIIIVLENVTPEVEA